jgi:hypothetical protein
LKTAEKLPTAPFSSCHQAGAEERVFIQYWPVLRVAKALVAVNEALMEWLQPLVSVLNQYKKERRKCRKKRKLLEFPLHIFFYP